MVDGVLSEMLGFCLDDRMVLGENLIIKRSTRDQPRYVAIGSEEYGGFAAYVNPEITQKVANELLAYKDTLTGAQFIDKAEELSKKLLKNPNDIITVSTLHHNQFKEMASYIHHHH